MSRAALVICLAIPAAFCLAGCGSGGGNAGGTGGASGSGAGAGGSPAAGSGGASGGSGGTAGGGTDAASPNDSSSGGSAGEAGVPDGGPGGSDAAGGRDGAPQGATRSFVYASGYAPAITIFSLNTTTGALTPAGTATTGPMGEPTSLAFSPDKRFLYAGDEQKNGAMGRVVAYAINQTTGALQEINNEGTRGMVTAHVGVHPGGKWVLTANYDSGTVTVFPVRADGGVGPGMTPVAAGGQSHYIAFDATGTFLFVPCVASNHIAMFRFADGVLTPNTPPSVAVPGGPRHLAFSPDDRFAYLLTQGQSTVVVLTHDKTNGRLTVLETVPSTPSGSVGAHIAVHPSGKFVYASNRSDNSVTIFTADAGTGRLTRVGYQRGMISYPWWFGMDAAGQLMIVASDRSASLLVHRIDQTAGTLQPLGSPVTVVMRPTYVGILTVPE